MKTYLININYLTYLFTSFLFYRVVRDIRYDLIPISIRITYRYTKYIPKDSN